MPLYIENQAFGGKAVSLSGLSNASPLYIGSALGVKTSDTTAKAIDMKCARKYKDRFFFRILEVESVTGTGLGYVEFTFYSLPTETGAKNTANSFVTYRVTKAMLDGAKRSPIEVSVPSTFGRYVRLEVNTDATAAVAGSILVTIEETPL